MCIHVLASADCSSRGSDPSLQTFTVLPFSLNGETEKGNGETPLADLPFVRRCVRESRKYGITGSTARGCAALDARSRRSRARHGISSCDRANYSFSFTS